MKKQIKLLLIKIFNKMYKRINERKEKYKEYLYYKNKREYICKFLDKIKIYNLHYGKFIFSEEELLKYKYFIDNKEIYNKILEESENIQQKKIQIFDKTMYFSNSIKWNVSFNNGYWKNIYYKRFNKILSKSKFLPPIYKTDIKYNWEFNKLLFLHKLLIGYMLSDKSDFLESIKYYINDWIDDNKFLYGNAWTANLIVSQRLIVFSYIYLSIYNDLKYDKDFLEKFLISIYEHYLYVVKHYEKGKKSSNHYIGNLSTIIFTLVLFPFFDKSNRDLKYALSELEKELINQFRDDNLQYEQSTGYYRYILEFLILVRIICKKNNISFNYELLDSRIKGLEEFISLCVDNKGEVIEIGDFDSARVLGFSLLKANDFSLYKYIIQALFDNTLDTNIDSNIEQEIFWWTGKINLKKNKENNKIKEYYVKHYKESGFLVLDSHKNKFKLIIDNGNIGMDYNDELSHGTHGHDDNLSFNLIVGGKCHIVDTGTGTYTASKKVHDYFRSTKAHNCLTIDGKSYSKIENTFWGLSYRAKPTKFDIIDNVSNIIFNLQIHAYKYLNKNIFVNRKITWEKNNILYINDEILNFKKGQKKLYLHFHPNCKLTINNNIIISENGHSKIKIIFKDDVKINIYKGEKEPFIGWFSEEYNKWEPTFTSEIITDMNNLKYSIIMEK